MSAPTPYIECECGLLVDLAGDPTVPIELDWSSGTFYLVVSPTRSVMLRACAFCGARIVDPNSASDAGMCSCECMQIWALDPEIPIQWNENTKQFLISGLGPLRYCFACGGRLPGSESAHFMVPSEAERTEFFQRFRAANIKSIEDAILAFGTPPNVDLICAPMDRVGVKNVRRQIIYSDTWTTIVGIIQEMEDGEIIAIAHGKVIPKKA